MKLRNKKTGKVVEAYKEEPIDLFIYLGTDEESDELDRKTYRSIAELNEEWEDYTLKEPLLRDEDIRKVVRAWARVNDEEDDRLRYYSRYNRLSTASDCIEFSLFTPFNTLEDGKDYTIDELCGEEEE